MRVAPRHRRAARAISIETAHELGRDDLGQRGAKAACTQALRVPWQVGFVLLRCVADI